MLTNHLDEHRLQSCSWAQVPGCGEPPASAGEVQCWMPAARPASLYMLYTSRRRVQHAQEIKIFMMALISCCSFSRRPSAKQKCISNSFTGSRPADDNWAGTPANELDLCFLSFWKIFHFFSWAYWLPLFLFSLKFSRQKINFQLFVIKLTLNYLSTTGTS